MALQMPILTMLVLAVFAILAIFATVLIMRFLKNFLINSVLGVIALLAINLLGKDAGFEIPITIITTAVSGVLGLAGVGLLIVLKLLGVNIS
ncbi:MAG: pro-sigmaK processing inhibitor BofA family protein [Candidatus Micrarchaeia archaeon]